MNEPIDNEFQNLSKEARYRYWERVGMICADGPVTADADQIARLEAVTWDAFYEP